MSKIKSFGGFTANVTQCGILITGDTNVSLCILKSSLWCPFSSSLWSPFLSICSIGLHSVLSKLSPRIYFVVSSICSIAHMYFLCTVILRIGSSRPAKWKRGDEDISNRYRRREQLDSTLQFRLEFSRPIILLHRPGQRSYIFEQNYWRKLHSKFINELR